MKLVPSNPARYARQSRQRIRDQRSARDVHIGEFFLRCRMRIARAGRPPVFSDTAVRITMQSEKKTLGCRCPISYNGLSGAKPSPLRARMIKK
jgi:hypothetical protein